jgi:prepilin-type N-terminal cleavage/methylation domain-containing protein
MRSRASSRGYTVVEVLSAMTLFAIGAAGVISMQRVTIQGGNDARHFDVASNIAQEWSFRLQRDAMFWTLPNADDSSSNLSTATKWLTDITSYENTWRKPTTPALNAERGMSPAFDLLGRDRPAGSGDHIFCVQYRLAWIAKQEAATPLGGFMRAETRVIWARIDTPNIDSCDDFTITPDPNKYHFVYTTTMVRSNPSQ